MKKTGITLAIVFSLLWGMARCSRIEPPAETEPDSPKTAQRSGLAKLIFGTKRRPPSSVEPDSDSGRSYQPQPSPLSDKDFKRSLEIIKEAKRTRTFIEAENLRRKGDYEQALKRYDRALASRPENGYIRQRRLLALRPIQQLESQENGYLQRASSHLINRRLEAAEEAARLALEAAGGNPYIEQKVNEIIAICYRGKNRLKATAARGRAWELHHRIQADITNAYFYLERGE
ncbi:MAG: hypothetical protein QGH40_07495 [bacterium]|nr:hypothetical protein [bacterium]